MRTRHYLLDGKMAEMMSHFEEKDGLLPGDTNGENR